MSKTSHAILGIWLTVGGLVGAGCGKEEEAKPTVTPKVSPESPVPVPTTAPAGAAAEAARDAAGAMMAAPRAMTKPATRPASEAKPPLIRLPATMPSSGPSGAADLHSVPAGASGTSTPLDLNK